MKTGNLLEKQMQFSVLISTDIESLKEVEFLSVPSEFFSFCNANLLLFTVTPVDYIKEENLQITASPLLPPPFI